MAKKPLKKIITPEFRGSYVNVLTPSKFNENDATEKAKYTITIMMDKAEPIWKEIRAEMDAVCIAKWGEVPKSLRTYIKDGDDGEFEGQGWEGQRGFKATSKTKPGVVVNSPQGLVPPVEPEEIYSGAYFRASISIYPFEFKGKGVAFALNSVMKTRDGEPFSKRSNPEEDFAEFVDTSAKSAKPTGDANAAGAGESKEGDSIPW